MGLLLQDQLEDVCLSFTLTHNKLKIDDVLDVCPLHGLCGTWGGVAAGIFGTEILGGLGEVSIYSQLIGTFSGVLVVILRGFLVYGSLKLLFELRLNEEDEKLGNNLSINKVSSTNN